MILPKIDSLERYLQVKLLWLYVPTAIFLALWMWSIDIVWPWIVISEIAMLAIYLVVIASVKLRVMRAFTRATLHLDAISQEDYNQFAKSSFARGKVKEFHQQLKSLSEQLQETKSRYDQHGFLVYHLIAQLASPIIVFNKKQQLSFANDAFSQLYKKHWQMFRHASPELLGLSFANEQWHFTDAKQQRRWQIRHSQFVDNSETHELLIFIDIESALRESQLNAWQQIIRVLGHEIKNSLTPVSSMAESLADKATNKRDKMVLDVITDRCSHLQQFVDRYASLSQQYQLNAHWVVVDEVVKSIEQLYSDLEIERTGKAEKIWADRNFFEQVMINLVKNSKEAGATKITLNFDKQDQFYVIDVIDNGHGFSNMDNLFVPLYTTKPLGQGIGLSFCRNIIERHNGVLELHNNEDTGVTVMIVLPRPSSKQK